MEPYVYPVVLKDTTVFLDVISIFSHDLLKSGKCMHMVIYFESLEIST